MEKLGGEKIERLEQDGAPELVRERARNLGGAVITAVGAEQGETKESGVEQADGEQASAEQAVVVGEREEETEFQRLVDAIGKTNLNVINRLEPSNFAEAEAEFLTNEALARPNFRFDKIDGQKVEKNLQSLAQIRTSIEEGDFSDKQRMLLEMVARDKESKNRLLQAADNYNHATSAEMKQTAKAEYVRENAERFGEPDKATFESILLEKFQTIPVEKLSEEQKQAYDALRQKLKIDELKETERFRPQPETVEKFGELIEMLYANLFAHIPEGKEKFTPEEVRDIVQEILDEEFGGRTNFRAEYVPDGTNLSVDPGEGVIKIPGKRARGEFTAEQVRNVVIGHELGTHTYRSIVHNENPAAMFRKGLPNYEEFDEGIAVCVQQALAREYPKSRDSFHYINIGLATFRDMNFREIFETQKSFQELLTAVPEETPEALATRRAKIEKRAFADATRCFRGTGELVSTKDLVYQRGSDQVWEYIEQRIDDPEGLLRSLFLSGKTNQLDPDQERLTYETQVGGL